MKPGLSCFLFSLHSVVPKPTGVQMTDMIILLLIITINILSFSLEFNSLSFLLITHSPQIFTSVSIQLWFWFLLFSLQI